MIEQGIPTKGSPGMAGAAPKGCIAGYLQLCQEEACTTGMQLPRARLFVSTLRSTSTQKR